MDTVEIFQNGWELSNLVAIFDNLRPARVLEIGAWHGGTLQYWLLHNRVVVVDDEMRRAGDWQEWAKDAGADLFLIRGMSQQPDVVEEARCRGPYDFIFIDADHFYDSVRADWDNYFPMLAGGGVIALHDILPRPGYGVSKLWEQIKELDDVRYMEICHNKIMPGNEGRCGIGVVFT